MDWKLVENAIYKIILDIKEKCVIDNVAIRDDIFNILETRCNVIYYPLKNENNKGFHIKKIVGNKLEDFVYINTAKPIDEQIFVAAHEFGHIWDVANKVWNNLNYKGSPTQDQEEDITNRFAAELLMPKKEFCNAFIKHIAELNIKLETVRVDELIKVIILLMNDFGVPYVAVRKRLVEVNILNEDDEKHLLFIEKDILKLVEIFAKDRNTYLGIRTNSKTISGLRNLIEKAEKQNIENPFILEKIKKEYNIEEQSISHKIKIQIGDDKDE